MNVLKPLPGSFRDPSGHVYNYGDRIIRTVSDAFAADFEFVNATGLFKRLAANGDLLPFEQVDAEKLEPAPTNARYLLEVPRLQFVSYPYEWPFPALKAAALLHLDVHLAALDCGVTMTDASAYNVQFNGTRPVFIDHLSFRRYRAGEIWIGHRQFCEQFLNPLLVCALFGINHNAWYRGTQEGISALELARLLKWRHYFSWNCLTHVALQSYFQKTAKHNTIDLIEQKLPTTVLPLATFKRMLKKLQDWIQKLEPAVPGKTIWRDYTKTHGYSSEEVQNKKRFVAEFVSRVKPRLLWDLGCNTGDYSISALEAGVEYVVGFDFDQGALEAAFVRARDGQLPFQPLFLDAANPTPNQGWKQQERAGLQERASADGILALALVHHLAITRNIPLDQLVDWLVDLAPRGVVEFVPKSDSMVQALLRWREDIFPDYRQEYFFAQFARRAKVVKSEVVSSSGRLLIWYERN